MYIELNSHYTYAYGPNKRQSVAGHEWGHGLGLAHRNQSSCSGIALMQYDTPTRFDQCGKFRPQTDDINGINGIYGAP